MDQIVHHYFYEGVFFKTLLHGDYSIDQLRYFAIQYSYYSRHFPRVLGAAISAMEPQSEWWIPLADNLWDEAGRGIMGRDHESLYRTFLTSVYPSITLDQHGIPLVPMSSSVSEAITGFIHFFRNATPIEAMAAVGFGSEYFAGTVMGMIAKGMEHPHYQRVHPIDVTFWTAHAHEHEPHHYQLCKNILMKEQNPINIEIMYRTGKEIAISEATMYTNLHKEMLKL